MVFESLVVDVLNRFLGDYVVNLDESQLSLGIWKGAVVLKNLEIKENALSELDVPFKVKVGHIGIKYDPIKEEKHLMEAKQQELKRIEEAKQKVVDQENPLEEKQDTFSEKLITQIIKNLQVKISNIHVRYEDDITNQDKPLSFGISLQNLSMQTADQNWIPCLHDETEKLVRKLIRLDNLFAYWNAKSQMYYLNGYDESLELEKTLDVFNITIARQQSEVEVKKAGYKIYKEGVKDPEDNAGWFSWLWTWSESHPKQQLEVKPGSGILEEMLTPEEKVLLYEAIGYSETAVDPTLPKTFEALKLFVHLKSMSIILRENYQKPELVDIVVKGLSTSIVQRPGAQAIKFETKIDSFHITGLPDNSKKPHLLSSLDNMSLFQITFETNPVDETVAQRCIIEAEPLEIIYDARTVNSIVEFFRPPKDVHLAQLTSATLTKLEEFRDKTATGLLYIIETQKVLDLRINVKASYVIVPQYGNFSPTSNLLLLDLGHLKVTSKSRSGLPGMKPSGASLEEIMHRAYDSFDIQLTSIQLLYSRVGDNWKEARKLNVSTQHILTPMHVNVEVSKAMVFMDVKMPKGSFSFLPYNKSTDKDSEEEFFDAPCSPLEDYPQNLSRVKSCRNRKLQKKDCSINLIQLSMRFEVAEVLIQFYHLVGDCELPVLEMGVLGLGTEVVIRTFDLKANAFLKEFWLKCPEYLDENKKPVYLITTLDNTIEDLLTMEFVRAEKIAPNLKYNYNNVLQLIKVNFSSLDIHLHTEALLNTMNYLNNSLPQLAQQSASVSVAETEDKGDIIKKLALKLPTNEDIITLQLLAELSCLRIFIQDQKKNISEIKIEGLDSEMIMKPLVTEINAKLRNIVVLDSDKMAVYKK
ncbi:hypothetical protein STEG23_002508, partial [Scotinomys teguina]